MYIQDKSSKYVIIDYNKRIKMKLVINGDVIILNTLNIYPKINHLFIFRSSNFLQKCLI